MKTFKDFRSELNEVKYHDKRTKPFWKYDDYHFGKRKWMTYTPKERAHVVDRFANIATIGMLAKRHDDTPRSTPYYTKKPTPAPSFKGVKGGGGTFDGGGASGSW